MCGPGCDVVLCVFSGFTYIPMGRESCLLRFNCVIFMCVFVSLLHAAMGWSVIVAFPGHTHLFL